MINPGNYRARCTGPADAQWGVSQNRNLVLSAMWARDPGMLSATQSCGHASRSA